jgi:type I restriction enzyme S subunit
MKLKFECLGDYIQLVDERNVDLQVSQLLGININKTFMPSVANTSGIDFSKYKIVKKGIFACNVMHVGRDERLPVALYDEAESAMVSPAYLTFEIKNTDELIPEFLMMIFQRPEFDRYTWFISDSSVRGGLEWERFCSIKIPIPKVDSQEIVISMYKVLERRKKINKKLNDLVSKVCPILIEGLIDNLS